MCEHSLGRSGAISRGGRSRLRDITSREQFEAGPIGHLQVLGKRCAVWRRERLGGWSKQNKTARIAQMGRGRDGWPK